MNWIWCTSKWTNNKCYYLLANILNIITWSSHVSIVSTLLRVLTLNYLFLIKFLYVLATEGIIDSMHGNIYIYIDLY